MDWIDWCWLKIEEDEDDIFLERNDDGFDDDDDDDIRDMVCIIVSIWYKLEFWNRWKVKKDEETLWLTSNTKLSSHFSEIEE